MRSGRWWTTVLRYPVAFNTSLLLLVASTFIVNERPADAPEACTILSARDSRRFERIACMSASSSAESRPREHSTLRAVPPTAVSVAACPFTSLVAPATHRRLATCGSRTAYTITNVGCRTVDDGSIPLHCHLQHIVAMSPAKQLQACRRAWMRCVGCPGRFGRWCLCACGEKDVSIKPAGCRAGSAPPPFPLIPINGERV